MKKVFSFLLLIFTIFLFIFSSFAESEINRVEAKVIKNNGTKETTQEDGSIHKIQSVLVRILEGEYKEEEYELEYVLSEDSEDITTKTELKEKDKIIIEVKEENGEVDNITFIEMKDQNYILYATLPVILLLLLIFGRTRVIKPSLKCITIIIITFGILIFSIYKQWNLILISSIISVIVTILSTYFSVKDEKKPISNIICTLLGISTFGIISYIFFDKMNISDTLLNVQISNIFVNIKQLLCSMTILICCGICNIISIIYMLRRKEDKDYYNIKSKNLLEGKRSLKL